MATIRRLLRPWHPSSPIPVWLLAALAFLASYNLAQLVAAGPGPDQAVDLRPLYLGAGILLDGGNPYDDALLKRRWLDTAQREAFRGTSLPGLPRTPLVYPPWALPLFAPLSALPWLIAAPIWYGTIAVLLGTVVLLLGELTGARPRLVAWVDLLVLALAFKAIDWAALVGQPLFLCLALGVGSWWLTDRGRPAAAGVALGLAIFKVHLAPPFVLLALARRRWMTVAAAALTVAALAAVFVVLSDHPVTSVDHLAENLATHKLNTWDQTAEGYPLSRKIVWTTSLAALAELAEPGGHRYRIPLNFLLLAVLAPFWARPLAAGRVSPARLVSMAAVLTLLATRHFHYDCLVLLPLYLVAREAGSRERVALLAAVSPLLLPINGVLTRLALPAAASILFFNVQLSLLALAAVLSWGVRRDPAVSLQLQAAAPSS